MSSRAIVDGDRQPIEERPPPPPRKIISRAVVSLRTPAIVAQLLLACWVPLAGTAVVFLLMERSLAHRLMDNPTRVTFSELRASDDRINAINGVFVAMTVSTGIAFIVWFRRAYRNLDGLDAPRRYGIGWATGAWFVPVLNLFRPKRIADDIWAGNDVSDIRGRSGAPRPKSALLICWWTAWVVATVLGFFGARTTDKNLHDLLDTNSIYLARDIAFVVAAVLAVFVVRRITRGQAEVVEASRAK